MRLTGSLGDVMKESAMAAFSFVRGHAKELKINPALFQKCDFHIHVPDGATPKDGPSAGVTLVSALVSLLTNRPVRPKLAMTGEITLSGKVTAIGGVREKVIAALRTGIHDVILPEENRKDLEDIPEDIRNQVRYHFVNNILDLLKITVPAKLPKLPAVDPLEPAKAKDEIYEFILPVQEEATKPAEQKTEEKKPLSGKEAREKFLKDLFEGHEELEHFLESLGENVSLEEATEKIRKRFPDRHFRVADPEKSQFIDVADIFPMKDKVYHDLEGAEDPEKEDTQKQNQEPEKGLQFGPELPPQNLTISVQAPLNSKKEEPAEEAAAEEEYEPAAKPECSVKQKYTAKRKSLFATPVKRKITRGIDLIRGKKKRGK